MLTTERVEPDTQPFRQRTAVLDLRIDAMKTSDALDQLNSIAPEEQQ